MDNKKKKLLALVAAALVVVIVVVTLLIGGSTKNYPVSDPATGRFDAVAISHEEGGVKLGKADKDGFTLVAENDALRVSMNLENLALRVEDKEAKNVYYSYAGNDEGLNKRWKNFMYSGVTLEYMTPETKLVRVPFADSGATAEVTTFKTGADVRVTFAEGFQLTVCLDIADGNLTVTVPESSIVEPADGSMVLENLFLYPFLGATHGMENSGYLFVPDGCGALVRMSHMSEDRSASYSKRVYGPEKGIGDYIPKLSVSMLNPAEQIYMPVFGIVQEENKSGIFGIIQSGAEYAFVEGYGFGKELPTNMITAKFVYRETYSRYLNQAGTTLVTNQPMRNSFDAQLRYTFLSGKEANYSGMAAVYKDYLVNKGVLTEGKIDTNGVPMNLEILFSEQKKELIGTKTVVMTTLEDAQQMLADLRAQGITNLNVMIRGYSEDGASAAAPVDGTFNNKVGSAKQWTEFVQQCKDAGVQVAFYTDIARAYNGVSNFNNRTDVASNFNELQLRAYENGVFFYLAPKVVSQKLANAAHALGQTGASSVVVDVVGNNLYSTWNKHNTNTRTETMEIFAGLTAKDMKTGFYTPAAYLWQNADTIFEIPSSHSGYMVFSDTVPFMQMVLKGYVDYYAPYSNFNADRQMEMLQMVEQGAYPSWIVTGQNSLELLNTPSSWLYTSEFSVWKGEMVEEYQYVAPALNAVLGAEIVSHEQLAEGIVCVSYDNGVSIVVNYTNADFNRGGVAVKAMDFTVIEK